MNPFSYKPSPHQVLFDSRGYTVELCFTPESLQAAQRLRYESYLLMGMIASNSEKHFKGEFDEQPNAYTLLISRARKPVGAIGHSLFDEQQGWQQTYLRKYHGALLESFFREGESLIEVGRLAVVSGLSRQNRLETLGISYRAQMVSQAFWMPTRVLVHMKKIILPYMNA